MKLKLAVRRGADVNNLLITADGTTTAGDIAAALMAADPNEPGELIPPDQVSLRVTGSSGESLTLPHDTALIDSGVRSGMTIDLVGAPQSGASRASVTDAVAVMKIVDGPEAGRLIRLGVGVSTVGRAADNVVVLNDPLVSKAHARIIISSGVEIADLNSANGVLVWDHQVTRSQIGPDDIVKLGDTSFTVKLVRKTGLTSSTTNDLTFNRAPLILARPKDDTIDLPDPPEKPNKQRFPFLAMIAPLVTGAVMYLTMGENARITSLIFVAMSPVLMLANWVSGRITSSRKFKDDISAFGSELKLVRRRLDSAHTQDRTDLLAMFPSVREIVNSAARLGSLLWMRRTEHPEFLRLRLGLGDIPAITKPERSKGKVGLVEFEEKLDALEEEFSVLHNAPVVANLRDCGSLGVCGPRDLLDPVMRGLIAELICTHSPGDLALACMTSKQQQDQWGWLEWIPHTSSPNSPLGQLHLASDPPTVAALLTIIEELVDARAGRGSEPKPRGPADEDDPIGDPKLPAIVVLVDDAIVDRARLTRVAERGPDVGVHLIWCADSVDLLPGACRAYLDLRAEAGESRFGQVRQGVFYLPVTPEPMDADSTVRLARFLAPVQDAGLSVADSSDIPPAISVVALTGQEIADVPNAVLEHWRANQSIIDRRPGTEPVPLKSKINLRAVVGHTGNDVFTLDLREQGPHALVGGTTGSGKSEFLQAWVLGMAAAHSPDRVSFLFVDYKGGAAFSKCLQLPHTVGLVTDLSPYLVRRALTSLRAELHYRETLLNAKSAKDLVELEKRGDPDCPPSLIIVVDEFAALAGEVPEFVDGVVDVAQRGRSLGLHLILATQRPAGVIKDNLRANTNLRVALRMADEHDSQDVLGDKMAAFFEQKYPGRGAAKTGPGRITQFQSAYPGAKTPAVAMAVPVEVAEMSFGIARPWKTPKASSNLDQLDSDIDRLVGTICAATSLAKIPNPRKPWLDSLASAYDLARLPKPPLAVQQALGLGLALGVIDDPAHQDQHVEFFRPDNDGNVVYFGAGGSGKTNALRSLALAACVPPESGSGAHVVTGDAPDPTHIYGLDFAGGGLNILDALPNCGAVIDGGDEERVARLFRWLRGVADERQGRYTKTNSITLTGYRVASGNTLEPRILVLIDGLATFRSVYETTTEKMAVIGIFQQLLTDGPRVGIHFAVTADRAAALTTSLSTAFQSKVVLRQTDADGYGNFNLPKDVLSPASPPGRCLRVGLPQELQLAILGTSVSVDDQANTIKQLAEYLADAPGLSPYRIQALPSKVAATEMPTAVEDQPVLGVADTTLAPVGFNPQGPIMVWGPHGSGRTESLIWLAHSLRAWKPGIATVLLAPKRSSLSADPIWTNSATTLRGCIELLERVKAIASEENPADEPQIAVFVEKYPDFISTEAENLLVEVVKACKTNGHVVVAEGESAMWSGGGLSSLLSEIKNGRAGLLLAPESSDGDSVLRTPLPKFRKTEEPPGRGWWVQAGKVMKVQVPLV